MKIELKDKVMIAGEMKQDGDVVEVEKNVGKNLIRREKAVETDKEIGSGTDKTPQVKPQVSEEALTKLKEIAQKLEVKFAHNLGYTKLEVLVRAVLVPMAEKLKIDAIETKTVEVLYTEITSANKQNPPVAQSASPEALEKLKEIAQKLEIKFGDNAVYTELEANVKETLVAMAKKLEIENVENKDVFELYDEVVEKIKEDE